MKIIAIQGPNMNRLGVREPERYGTRTLAEVQASMDEKAAELGASVEHFQSNSEGALIDWVQERQDAADGVICNPAGLTNYGLSLRDALKETLLPVAIVHVTTLFNREPWRLDDKFGEVASSGYICGIGWHGYLTAVEALVRRHAEPKR